MAGRLAELNQYIWHVFENICKVNGLQFERYGTALAFEHGGAFQQCHHLKGTNMSEWGTWGYLGIVAGLAVMLAVFLLCMVFMYRTPETTETAQTGSHGEHPEESATDTKHAA